MAGRVGSRNRGGSGSSLKGPVWLKQTARGTPHVSCMTPYVFSNSADLTGNDTLNLSYGGAGADDVTDADRVQAVVPFDGSVVAWSGALDAAPGTASSTAKVIIYAAGASLTGTLGSYSFTTATAATTYNSTSDLTSYAVSAGDTLSVSLVMSNHTFGAVNNAAISVFVV